MDPIDLFSDDDLFFPSDVEEWQDSGDSDETPYWYQDDWLDPPSTDWLS